MFSRNTAVIACLALTIPIGLAVAQPPAQPGGAPPAGRGQRPPLAPIGPGSGPYAAISEVDPSLPTHTVLRPSNLNALGNVKLPILAWANGGCANSPRDFEPFLAEIASHGFLVIAIGTTPPPQGQTSSKQLNQAIDWADAQNKLQGSKYQGKLDLTKVAVAGQSCGGLQAIEASLDPRVTTTLVCNSGIFNTPRQPGGRATPGGAPTPGRGPAPAGAPEAAGAQAGGRAPMSMSVNIGKDILDKLHTPMLYMLGGPTDIAFENGTDDVKRIGKVPVFFLNLPVGHGGTYREVNGGEFGKVAVAWLKWQLKGDQTAMKTFVGPDCGICANKAWTIEVKNYK